MDVRVVDNPEQLRYELWLGATRAGFIQYRSEPGTILLVHTEVESAFEGQGLGLALLPAPWTTSVRGALRSSRCARSFAPTCAITASTRTWWPAVRRSQSDHGPRRARRATSVRPARPCRYRAQLGTPVVCP